jgi:uncharacterized protein YjdB
MKCKSCILPFFWIRHVLIEIRGSPLLICIANVCLPHYNVCCKPLPNPNHFRMTRQYLVSGNSPEKFLQKLGLQFLCLLVLVLTALTSMAQSDGLPRGAHLMPYKRYEASSTSIGGGATMLAPTFDQKKTESEASDQTCASLNATNSFVAWNLTASGQGLVLRFSMPDNGGGTGQTGSLALYIGGTFVQNISLSSKWAWQYFSPNPGDGTKDPSNQPTAGWTARMRFDEVRVKLPSSVNSGTEIKLVKANADGINYLVDFIEVEPIPAQVSMPANYINVVSHGATANDATDDINAFVAAIGEARTTGKSIYVPAGRFNLSRKLDLININNVTIQGAGMWHTELYYTNPSPGNGGIETGGTNMDMKDFYMNTENTTRALPYKAFTGGYGTNSTIERVWAEHFEVGAWIANWSGPASALTDGLIITNCRFRNNYADGVNFSKGTSNSICEHTSFRNNGDDAMATWSSFDGTACLNNEFRYCTAENTWRAAGIGFFGGGGHKGHHLLIKDGVETGIRVNSDFPGPEFSTTLWMEISETTVIGCGTNANLWFNRYGAVDIFTRLYNLQNLRLRNVDILNSQKDGIMIYTVSPNFTIKNLELINVKVDGTGRDGNVNNYTQGTYDDYAGYGLLVLPNVSGFMSNTNVVILNAATAAIQNESSATFTINTVGTVPVTGVAITPTSAVSIPQGGTAQLTAAIQPSNATNQNVTWTSGTPSVATVNASGLVSGVAPGTSVITVRTQDGNFTATKTVTVTSAVNIAATDNAAGEGGNPGVFTISTSGTSSNITVGYTVSGTASSGDYSASPALSGSVTLTSAAPSATITINPADDTSFEGSETLTLTLQPGAGYNLGGSTVATVNIADNDNPPCTAPVIAFTSTAPVIDQGIDATWSNAPAGTISNVTLGSMPADFAGSRWRAMYDNANMYLLVEVKDNNKFNDSGASWWEDDVIEIFIDGDNSKGTSYDGQNDFQLGFRYNDANINVGGNSVNRTTGIVFAIQNVTGGYNLEARIPWSTIGVTPGLGNRIGFEVEVDDDDNGGTRDSQVSAFATTSMAWSNPSLFGTVFLTTCNTSNVPVTGVTVTPSAATVNIGATTQLSATVQPSNATNQNVSWSTSNASVATVNGSGLVTGVAQGTATITVTTQDGNKTASSAITVSTTDVPVTGVTVSPTTASLNVGATQSLVATVAPANATNKNVSWSTSNAGVATVNSSGLVTAVAVGNATITVTTQDGNKTATSAITVTSSAQTPFGGTAWAIPGVIEAENFDNGGEGVAYHDNDAINSGGQGRTGEGVDTENCSEGTLNVGWTGTGEWYEYTVNVASAGTYNIDVRTASIFAGGTFHIEFGGVDKTGLMTTTNTGAWQTWTTISKTNVSLNAGVQVMRIFLDNANYNINKITISSTANVPVTGVTVSPTSASVAVGSTQQLQATVAPSNATNKNVSWSTSNAGVATVNSAGLVTGVAAGNATITVTTQDGNKTATSAITVATASGSITCFRAPGAVTVNGSLTETGWVVTRAFSKTTTGSPNNTATFGVMWDNTNLYIGARILDANLHSDSPDPWEDDAVEVYIDANNNKLTTYDGADNQIIKNYNKSTVFTKFALSGLQHGWAAVSGGYTIELAVPWSSLGISAPAQGTTIGFDIGYDDDDNAGGRDGQAVWNGTVNNYQNTSGFGSVVLNSANSGARESTSIAVVAEEEQPLTYSPNPVSDHFSIRFNGQRFSNLAVIDALGRVHEDINLSEDQQEVTLHLGRLNHGAYLVRLKGVKGFRLIRIIKQ